MCLILLGELSPTRLRLYLRNTKLADAEKTMKRLLIALAAVRKAGKRETQW